MRNRLKVLVVEDDPAVQRLLCKTLVDTDWEVVAVATAESAHGELERSSPFDAVLIDKNLPDMSGIELVRRLRQSDKRAMVAIITAYPSAASAAEALNLGIDAYIPKPVDNIFELVERLRALVARRQASLAHAPIRATHLRAVIASPDASLRTELADLLGQECDEIEQVDSSSEALHLLDGTRLLLLDGTVSDPPADQVLRQTSGSGVAVVLLTDQNTPLLDIVEYVDLGVRALVEKPLSRKQFTAATAELLNELRRTMGG